MPAAPLSAKIVGLATVFVTSGVVHLMRPQVFEPIIPRGLPAAREIVYASGVAELLCAAGLLVPATRAAAGYGSAALLVGVLPANIQMSLSAYRRMRRRPEDRRRQLTFAGTIARVPLQWPLIRVALSAAGR